MIENGVFGFVQNLQKFLFNLSNRAEVDGLLKFFDSNQVAFEDFYAYMHYSSIYGVSHYLINLFLFFLGELIWFRIESYYRRTINHLEQVFEQFIQSVSIK